ncbi:MAG: ABC transporter permease [Spirochaetes bacterium]|nr:ABC transporter permease [Spirochaetota bacterium]HPA72293.1 ABC transporter permease [Spirochaetota bacterium]
MMKAIRKKTVLSFLRKEFRQLFRDRKMRIVVFAPPIVMMILFGYSINMDVASVSMAVLDQDRTAVSRALVERFTASGYFVPNRYLDSPREIDPLLDTGEAEFVLVVERGFANRVKSGLTGSIQTLVDGTDSSRAAVIVAYVNQITQEFSQQYLLGRIRTVMLNKGAALPRGRQGIGMQERFLFNPDLASRNFFLPGMLALLLVLVATLLTAMSIVREREAGTIEQIVVSPLRPMEYIAGKSAPFMLVGFLDIILISAIIIFWFRVPFNGSFLFLLASGLVYIFTCSSMGLFISFSSRTQQQAMLSSFLFFMPAILLSGFIFPIYSMPEAVQLVTYLNPVRYFIAIIRGVFLKGVGFAVLWKDLAALGAIGIALFYFSARRFARGIE